MINVNSDQLAITTEIENYPRSDFLRFGAGLVYEVNVKRICFRIVVKFHLVVFI